MDSPRFSILHKTNDLCQKQFKRIRGPDERNCSGLDVLILSLVAAGRELHVQARQVFRSRTENPARIVALSLLVSYVNSRLLQ